MPALWSLIAPAPAVTLTLTPIGIGGSESTCEVQRVPWSYVVGS